MSRLAQGGAAALVAAALVTVPTGVASAACVPTFVGLSSDGKPTYEARCTEATPGQTTRTAGSGGSSGGGGGGGGAREPLPGEPTCTYRLQSIGAGASDGRPGRYYLRTCTIDLIAPGAPIATAVVFVPDGAPPPGGQIVVDPQVIAADLRAELAVPVPSPRVNPDLPIVNLPTWLWVEGPTADLSASDAVFGVTATVAAELSSVTWDLGDGSPPVRCSGPGVAWRPGLAEGASDCTHTFVRSSAGRPVGASGDPSFAGRVTASWQVSWSSSTGASGVLPPLTRTETFDVPVGEIQTVVGAARG